MAEMYDFGGYATRNDVLCGDGRTIRKGAFSEQDGVTVPLVWHHKHNGPENVLGHALLEERPDGMYCYGKFNGTPDGQRAKMLVDHGDITSLSIFANKLKEKSHNVMHGVIREVSLVLSGANPGAYIDSLGLAHSDDDLIEEAVIYSGEFIEKSYREIEHSDDKELENFETEELQHASEEEKNSKERKEVASDRTIGDVIDSMSEEQRKVLIYLVDQVVKEGKGGGAGEDDNVKHNAFDTDEMHNDTEALMHDGLNMILADAKRCGSLKESFLAHAQDYGIENIDWLFPDYKNLTEKPGFLKRQPDEWVDKVSSGVHHIPFSRIKMMFADLREDEARAKGYPKKAQLKKEEVFGLLKRTVDPTTIYKKQKLDRDDINDITDFDVVSWIKGEMRMMLDEEISRAILFGDGRSAMDPDRIDQSKIIPIAYDAPLYTIHYQVTPETGEEFSHAFIKAAVKSQDTYEGSGNLTLFVPRSTVTDMLLFEDADGHRMYKTMAELTLALNVNSIVQVPAAIIPEKIFGVMVDLKDYSIGADKGGAISMFDDFDIDYNQQKYLIETRCSGALTKPFSAIVLEETEG